jgi:multidrug efflux pump subunit AcrB
VYFERFRRGYGRLLNRALEAKRAVLACMLVAIGVSGLAGYLLLGRDFFPLVDAGQIRLHVRAPAGTRIEETEHYFTRVEEIIRQEIPASELTTIMDNIGLPNSGLNLAQSDTATIGPADGEVLVELNQEHHHSTWMYLRKLRARLNRELPDCQFFTQPADIVSQILNSGLPAPIDLQIAGRSRVENYAIAQELATRIAQIPGAVDVHIHQITNEPSFDVNVDRLRASQIGLDQKTIAGNLLISLSGSSQAATNYWINPQNGVQYLVATQTPQYENASLEAVRNTPVGIGQISKAPEILSNVASIERASTDAVVSHYDVAPVFDVYANIDGKDLGSVSDAVNRLLPEYRQKLPRGSVMTVRGQAQSMNESFYWLGIGVVFAILLVYFLLVINFQSWIDPFIIIMALPGALCGIIAALILTRTTLNVPSLMGAIMSVGVATANSILVVTFANDQRKTGMDARAAALSAGTTRLRPVIMTALAMIIGMLPMSLGWGEGGEQNAPLGRAVIGGLVVATLATLFFVPVVYAALRKNAAHRPDEEIEEEMHEAHMPGH